MNLWHLSLSRRRWLIFSLCLLWTSLVSIYFNRQFFRTGLDSLDVVAAMIYLLLLVPNCFNLLLYLFGFWLCRTPLSRPDRHPFYEPERLVSSLQAAPPEHAKAWTPNITTRTALVMPIYHEEMERVYAGVRQTWLSVKKACLDQHCDFYLLCDSTDQQICEQEEAIYRKLLPEFNENGGESGRLFLIRRKERNNFKAGNIGNFVANHGGAYDFMLVLDADSVMVGQTIKRLILTMQQRPRLAVLQTVIIPIRAVTPFARGMQYFIGRCVAMYSSGMYWFTGTDAIYWGHNALIRIAPFIAHCNLPIMPGRPPLGGPIMSQDFVEAALLGRAGWAVEWDISSGGSFDELPANLITYGERDRRWCQGNFRNFWLMFGDGMKLAHRIYFGIGVMAYLASPLFLLMTILGFVQAVRGRSYQIESLMFWSFIAYFLLIMPLPKILGFLGVLSSRRHKNLLKEALSTLLEFGLMVLSAPILFYLHTRFVIGLLCGKNVAWKNQPRDPEGGVSWSEAAKAFWLPTVLGAIWLVLASLLDSTSLAYLSPVLAGWVFSIPIVVFTSNVTLGNYLTKHGLFDDCLTEDEVEELGPLLA